MLESFVHKHVSLFNLCSIFEVNKSYEIMCFLREFATFSGFDAQRCALRSISLSTYSIILL